MGTDTTRTSIRTRATRRGALAAVALSAALLAAGCSSEETTTTAETSVSASSGTSVDTTETTRAPGTTRSPGTTPGSTPPGTGVDRDTPNAELETDDVAADVEWSLNPSVYRDEIGLRIAYDCPPDGTEFAVWGDVVYTDDSSVCTAAVHTGLITLEDGGLVVVEMTEALEAYEGSTANGVTTREYASWGGSFIFPGA